MRPAPTLMPFVVRLISTVLVFGALASDVFAGDIQAVVTFAQREGRPNEIYPGGPAKALGITAGEPVTVTRLGYRDVEHAIIYVCDLLPDGKAIFTKRTTERDLSWLVSPSGEVLKTLEGVVSKNRYSIVPDNEFRSELEQTELVLFNQIK